MGLRNHFCLLISFGFEERDRRLERKNKMDEAEANSLRGPGVQRECMDKDADRWSGLVV